MCSLETKSLGEWDPAVAQYLLKRIIELNTYKLVPKQGGGSWMTGCERGGIFGGR